jgi:excisionase family DNA binding protein
MEKQTFSVPEAAEILGIDRNSGYAAAKKGELPTIRIGKRLLVPKAALARLLESTRHSPAQ